MFETVLDRPRWAIALDVFREFETGEVVPYERLGESLESEDRGVIQAAARDAAKRLLEEDSKAIEAVPNTGYRIVSPGEHGRLAKSSERRSRRALTKAHKTVTHVDLNGLEEDMKRSLLAQGVVYGRILDAIKQTDRNVARIAKAQDELAYKVDADSSEHRERLARLEAEVQRLKGEDAA